MDTGYLLDEDVSAVELRAIEEAFQNSLGVSQFLPAPILRPRQLAIVIARSTSHPNKRQAFFINQAFRGQTFEQEYEDNHIAATSAFATDSATGFVADTVSDENSSAGAFPPGAANTSTANNTTIRPASAEDLANIVEDAIFGCAGADKIFALHANAPPPPGIYDDGCFEPSPSPSFAVFIGATVKPTVDQGADFDHASQIPIDTESSGLSPASPGKAADTIAVATPRKRAASQMDDSSNTAASVCLPLAIAPAPAEDDDDDDDDDYQAHSTRVAELERALKKELAWMEVGEPESIRRNAPTGPQLPTEQMQAPLQRPWPYGNFDPTKDSQGSRP
ncbi:hypothetical protein diail_11587 [Diaporthe ilicicola]|nr:hypothetical protein diail_11587 [Diaporthe ilicicola]